MGFDIAVDGVIGPLTARAAQAASSRNERALIDAYAIVRRNFYYSLGRDAPVCGNLRASAMAERAVGSRGQKHSCRPNII